MGADLRTLFQDNDIEVRVNLFQTDRGRESCRSGTDDDHVIVHGFTHWFRHSFPPL